MQRELQRQVVGPAASAGRQAGESAGRSFSGGFGYYAKRTAFAVGGALAGITGFGLKTAANLETAQTAFTSLLGSAEAAQKQIADLEAFAARTPFQQQDVLGYAQQFFAIADSIGLAKSQAIPFLTVIGNIGAVTGASAEAIHNAVLAIGQIGAYGKVTLDNIRQISNAFPGFNAVAAIANGTGQTTAQVLKEINKGALGAQVGIQALLKGMQEFPGASAAMEKQALTLKGVWSTFTDTIRIKLTNAFQQLIPVVKQELTALTPIIGTALENLAPALTALVTNLAPVIEPLTAGLGQALTAIVNALGPALGALAPVIQPLANAFTLLVQAASPLLTFVAEIVAQLGPPLIGIFQNLVSAIEPLVAVLVASLQPVLPVLAQALTQIGQALVPVVAEIANALAPVVPILAQAFAELVQAVAPIAGELGKALVQIIKALAPLLVPMAKGVASLAHFFGVLLEVVPALVGALSRLPGVGHSLQVLFEAWAAPLKIIVKAFEDLGIAADYLSTSLGAVNNSGRTATIVGINPMTGAADKASQSFIMMASNALQARIVLAQLGLGARVTAADVISVTESIVGAVQAMALARGQAALALGLNAVAQAQAAADAAKTAGGLSFPALNNPDLSGADKKKKLPAFDVSTLTSFLSTAGITKNPLTEALNAIFESAKAAGKQLSSGLVNLLKSQNSDLIGLTNQRDRIAQKLQSAQQKLSDLVSQRKQEKDAIQGAVTDTFSLGNIPKPAFGEPVTLRDILRRLSTAVSNAKQFGSILRKLAREGLSPALLSQLAEAGPDALPAAKALLAATPRQLRSINSQFKQLTQTGSSIGKFVSRDMFNTGIDAARGLVNGLKSQQSALNKAIRQLAKSMVKELRDALGIHSPSTVLHQLGAFSGEGFARGLESTVERVRASADKLANGALPRSQAAAWSLSAGTGGRTAPVIGEFHQTIQNPVPEPASVSGPAGIRRAAYALDR